MPLLVDACDNNMSSSLGISAIYALFIVWERNIETPQNLLGYLSCCIAHSVTSYPGTSTI
jgi:hypothetical protein